MELKVEKYQIPEQVVFNYEDLKKELLEKVQTYETMVYTDDRIKEAKKDRANLNALKKALNDERIRREKEYMLPFNTFKSQIAEIIQIIDKPCMVIDKQVKEFEEKQKQEKLEAIKDLIAETAFPVSLEAVMDPKWLNASVSLKTIKEALLARKEQILSDMAVLEDLQEYKFEAKHHYMQTLDLASTMREVNRLKALQEAKEAYFRKQQEEASAKVSEKATEGTQEASQETSAETGMNTPAEAETQPERNWIGFQAYLSMDEAKLLGQFLRSKGIKYKAI